jgi:hypothetical protein
VTPADLQPIRPKQPDGEGYHHRHGSVLNENLSKTNLRRSLAVRRAEKKGIENIQEVFFAALIPRAICMFPAASGRKLRAGSTGSNSRRLLPAIPIRLPLGLASLCKKTAQAHKRPVFDEY